MSNPTSPDLMLREAWLRAAIEALRETVFRPAGFELPPVINVSTGFAFSRGENASIRAQAFAKAANDDGNPSIFVSPLEPGTRTATVLAVLVHELVHVHLDCDGGHGPRFAYVAQLVGLVAPLRTLHVGPILEAQCAALAESLGDYPHAGMDAFVKIISGDRVPAGAPMSERPVGRRYTSAPPTQTNRMFKAVCRETFDRPDAAECGYVLRVSRKWAAVARPVCPVHPGGVMDMPELPADGE